MIGTLFFDEMHPHFETITPGRIICIIIIINSAGTFYYTCQRRVWKRANKHNYSILKNPSLLIYENAKKYSCFCEENSV